MRGYREVCPRCGRKEVFMDELYDARGIYCGSACEHCMKDLEKSFRPEVLADPSYECCEDVEAD